MKRLNGHNAHGAICRDHAALLSLLRRAESPFFAMPADSTGRITWSARAKATKRLIPVWLDSQSFDEPSDIRQFISNRCRLWPQKCSQLSQETCKRGLVFQDDVIAAF